MDAHGMESTIEADAIAIVGLATRFPQDCTSSEELWKFLVNGRNAHTPFPEDRLGSGHYHPDSEHGGTHAVLGAHFLSEDPAYFDAPFFSITKGEALSLDPQQRLVLENVYLALENSGYSLDKVAGSNTSVFVSGFNHDHYALLNMDPEAALRYKATGTTNSMNSNRVSWFFDLKGASATVDTACSSSMVALHLGCQGLRTGETEMSVVSGVTVISYPGDTTSMSHVGFLGPTGKCFSFDHRAEGYGRGEGVGTVILKRVRDAVRDGDTIRAVIRGTCINQDGRTPGLTLPDSGAQERLIKKVYASAGLGFDQTAYVEAHGTGTAAGDPIEANGIARGFSGRKNDVPLYVGTIKASTGHLEGAAGVAGVIKSILMLESGIIPPQATFSKVNPKIPAKKWRLVFPTEATSWPHNGLRRISINSFGVGGTNAHTILDDAYNYLQQRGLSARHHTAPNRPTQAEVDRLCGRVEEVPVNGHANGVSNGTSNDSASHTHIESGWAQFGQIVPPPQIIPMSSFDEDGIQRAAKVYSAFIDSKTFATPGVESRFAQNFAHTVSKRSHLNWRSHILGSTAPKLAKSLSSSLPKPTRARGNVNVAWVLTGQSAQWYGMARELLCYPVFRTSLQEASAYFESLGSSWSLLDELAKNKDESNVNEPWLAQPACTAIQIALADLLLSWNVKPTRVVGHSSGEIAAALVAGKLDRQSALRAAYFRGVVSSKQTSKKGAMLAAGSSEAELRPYLEGINSSHPGALTIACINSFKNCTISGDEDQVNALRDVLDGDAIFARKLNVKKAYHSSHMEELSAEYLDLLGDLTAPAVSPYGKVHMFSTVTGSLVEDNVLGSEYWVKNLVSPVKFSQGMAAVVFARTEKGQASLRAESNAANVFADVVLELGPHGALQSAIKDTLSTRAEASAVTSFPTLNRSQPGPETILHAMGHLWCRGYAIDVDQINRSSDIAHLANDPERLVELPGYAFNHSQRFWFESRLARNYRLRKEPRHDLFGAPVPDWDVESPRWRNIIRLSEQPWIRDHAVTNSIIYPGVGYIIMAIEAARRIADPALKIVGFRVKDVALKRALVIPDTKDGIETAITMPRDHESSLASSTIWRRFSVTSFNPLGDEWVEHCTGCISTEYDVATGPVDNGREVQAEAERWRKSLQDAEHQATENWDISQAYESMAAVGLKFGPLFRNGSACRASHAGPVLGTITIPNVAQAMPKGHLSPHLIHPATMDSMMHIALGATMNLSGSMKLDAAVVPTFIKDIWVSANLTSDPGHRFRVQGRSHLMAFEKYTSDVRVWDESGEGCISIEGIQTTPLDYASQDAIASRKLCHEIEWVPYVEHLTADDLKVSDKPAKKDDLTAIWVEKLQLATLLLVTDALDELDHTAPPTLEGHLLRYFEWMKQLEAWMHEDNVSGVSLAEFQRYKTDSEAKAELYKQIEDYKADGRLAVRMGSNIVKVLRGEVDPLDLMFGQDDILDEFYAGLVDLGDLSSQQTKFLSILAENSTNLQVLEVGAGTGSSTRPVLEALAPLNKEGRLSQSSLERYTYTDLSSAFFDKAREKFKPHEGLIEYKVLNAEKDVAQQGFEPESYDLIIAQNVIHATADIQATLANLRTLLKPGGRFLLQEIIRRDYFWSPLAFGQLAGWWLGVEPMRQWGPLVTPAEWDSLFKASGYTGVDLELASSQDPVLHTGSVLVSRYEGPTATRQSDWRDIVLVSPRGQLSDVAKALQSELQRHLRVSTPLIATVGELKDTDLTGKLCISVAELEDPVLASLTAEEYEGVNTMLTVCKGLLWITGDQEQHPEFGMALGLLRTLRWERDLDEVNLITLSIADPRPSLQIILGMVIKLTKEQFSPSLPAQRYHGEYVLKDGRFLTSRLHTADAADDFLAGKFSKPKPVMMPLRDAGRPIKLSTASPGRLDTLEWVTDPAYDEPLAEKTVEIEIKAAPLNFRDVMIAMGEHMAYSMGCEAAGIVSRIGSDVTDFKIGDRVVYIVDFGAMGGFHTYGRSESSVVAKIPNEMSFEEAAGLPVVWTTVLYGLRDVGRLTKGESVLIHAAAGGVGQAAINYAKHIGAEVFATVSTPQKRDLLVKELGVPEDHIFSSRDLSFVDGVRRVTKGRGVDVVLNSLSGEALRGSWDLLAPLGRFVEVGKKDAQANARLEMRPLLRAASLTCVDLVTMMKSRPDIVKRLLDDTVALWSEGVVKPASPTLVKPMSQLIEGFQTLQTGKGVGKMVFVPEPEDVMPIVPARPAPFHLLEDATYVLAGGLGGLGRSIASWMAARGARTFVFLSSSGNITPPVAKLKCDLEAVGCKMHVFKCDVSDEGRLKEVVAECQATLLPVKGVIQGAMKLSDSILENMKFDAFQAAVMPKVAGSLNLHKHLPKDMDFFVMLSSATGILGNRGQANYAAGNTFQDTLAHHRRKEGLPATSIDVGAVMSVGYVAENVDQAAEGKGRTIANFELERIREEDIHALVEYAMGSDCPAQLVTGMIPMSEYRARGAPPPTFMSFPLFTHLNNLGALGTRATEDGGGVPVEALLNAAKTLDEAADIITTAARAKLASLLSVAVEDVDPERSVGANGVDSLVAIEFRAFLTKETRSETPMLDIMGTLSLTALCRKIATSSKAVQVKAGDEPAA
ncbi:unnamed protein product [Zymoseptoria tritici ST99CH_3D7]|uniref:Uncharacterized protein n=1 Tax=Zymoseptoria tritici (strain ST99CH_3D7) TaxID=1276538 RepID=A0A1X7S9Z0_ZYMT9|nr:unnamed protein product [Zymoseptoria tritici ST99CH_3D7]